MKRVFNLNMQEVTPSAGKHCSKNTTHTTVDPDPQPVMLTLGNIAKKENKARCACEACHKTFNKVTEGVAHAATHKRTECLSDMYDHVRLSNHKGWEDLSTVVNQASKLIRVPLHQRQISVPSLPPLVELL
ncbi:hypothetical protein ARMSODRAFT_979194 [Armillaria solidipes]|uniref:C2H2-type domain-containing protein n=1 Tax=Armillaria solidipes TaxID=1076256 RepID=A0A2H3BII9_9AGAR|nr:hypothetical protein ARMSODRAFT_979194 [Armillaria solidipes]